MSYVVMPLGLTVRLRKKKLFLDAVRYTAQLQLERALDHMTTQETALLKRKTMHAILRWSYRASKLWRCKAGLA
jgi:hypothetical protein